MQKEVDELKDAIRVSYLKRCLSNKWLFYNQGFWYNAMEAGVILFVHV